MGVRLRTDLLLGAGAFVSGALVSATAVYWGRISPLAFWGGLASSAVASVPDAALAVTSFLGMGYAVLGLLAPKAYGRLTRLECGFLSWVVGLLVASQAFWVLAWTGLYRPPILMGVQVAGALLLGATAFRGLPGRPDPSPPTLREQWPRLLLLALVGSVAGLFLIRTLGTRLVHPDALDYHLGLPMWYLRSKGFVHFPSLVTSGRYLGADILYGAVLAPAEPLDVIPAKLLSLCLGATTFTGTYLVARRLGAGPAWSIVAILGMITVPAISRWGMAKNDLATAGMALAALWLLLVALEEKEPRWSVWIGLCLGYAITVKPTMFVVTPAIGFALTCQFGVRSTLLFALGCLAPIAPWAFTTWSFRGVPLPHFMAKWPAYVEELRATRNANGLELTLGSFFRNAIPLLLDSDERVSGNDSLGVPFLVAGALGLLGCLRGRSAAAVYSAGLLFLAVGMLFAFEGRFLNRYFLLAPAVAFPTACAWLASRHGRPVWKRALPVLVGITLVTVYASGQSVFRGQRRRPGVTSIRMGGGTPKDPMARQLALTRQVEASLAEGEVLLINDGMIYFLSVPFVNAHALYSTAFRYDQLDAAGLAQQLQARRVGAALIRSGISGLMPQLLEVVAWCGTPLGGDPRLLLRGYRMDWTEEACDIKSRQGGTP